MTYKAFKLFKVSVLLSSVLIGAEVFAGASGTSVFKTADIKKNSEGFKVSTQLELKALSYVEASLVDKNFQQQIEMGLSLSQKKSSYFTNTQLMLGTFSEPKSFYAALPESYVGIGNDESSLTIGRKKENLSFTDTFFNLGLVQTHFTNDNINFIDGGLVGFSGHWKFEKLNIMASFNPIFIPNQGPQTTAENGKIVSTNRWASAPPSKFKFGEEYKNINYAITDYKISDIITNGGYMLHANYGSLTDSVRPVLSLSYARKPINDIALSRDTYSNISNFEGYVYLTPVVLNHTVMAMDVNIDGGGFKSSISYLADQPENKTAQDLQVIQTLSPLSIYSIYGAYDFTEILGKQIEVYMGAAIITGGEIKDLNSNQVEGLFTVVNSRTLFKKPIRMGAKGEMFFIYNQALVADLNLTYDQELKGSLMTASINHSPIKNLNLSIGADVIGVENELPENTQGSFLDQHKANDRFFGGMKYVF